MHRYLTKGSNWRRLILVLFLLFAASGAPPVASARQFMATAPSAASTITAAVPSAAPTIEVPAAGSGLLLAPRQTVSLTVQVTGSHGAPLSQTTVTFLAPAGMGSHFGGKFFAQVATDRRGMATARFTAGAGPATYLVDALIMGTRAATGFAITVEPRATMPPLNAARAWQAAQMALRLSDAQAAARLFGPVLLERGTLLGTPVPDTLQRHYVPTTITQRSWLLWADDLPGAGFAHPTRFVLLAAGSAHPAAQVTQHLWWPALLLPHATRITDLRPAAVTTKVAGTPLRAMAAAFAAADVSDSCAIVIHGDTAWAYRDEAARMSAALGAHGFQVFTTPDNVAATPSDLQSLIKDVQNKPGCKRLLLYIGSHGSNYALGQGGVALKQTPDSWGDDYTTEYYSDMAELLRPLAQKGVQLTLIVDACYSGSAITAMEAQGVPATILASADANHESYYIPWSWQQRYGLTPGGYYTTAFLQAMENPDTHAFHDGMLDAVAVDTWLKAHATDTYLTGPRPEVGHTTSHAPVSLRPRPVVIAKAGETLTWTVTRPPEMPLDSIVDIFLTIDDTGKATFAGGQHRVHVLLIEGEASAQVSITGKVTGNTYMTIDATSSEAQGRPYHDLSTIFVGSEVLVPNVKVRVGQTVNNPVYLTGAMAEYLSTGTYAGALVITEGYDRAIASIQGSGDVQDRIHLEHPNTRGTLVITGKHVGKTKVTVPVSMPRFPADTLVVTGTFTIEVVAGETVTTGITGTTTITPTVPITANYFLSTNTPTPVATVPFTTNYFLSTDTPTSTPASGTTGAAPPTNTPGRPPIPTATATPTASATPPATATSMPTATVTPTPTVTATPTPKRVATGLNTNELRFGYVQVGTTGATQSVTLTNTGDAPVNVSNVAVVGAQSGDFTLGTGDCATLAPGQSCSVTVTYKPSAPGPGSASLQFTDNAPDSPQMVALGGEGTEPPSVNGNNVNMGTVIEGQSETVTVTVENIGQVPVTVGNLDVSGANLTVTSNTCAGATLAPGGSCNMTLDVAGTTQGPFSDSVSISTTPAGGLQPVDVTGDVIPALS